MIEVHLECPSCGAELARQLEITKQIICLYCGAQILLEPAGPRAEGELTKLAEMPSLISIRRRMRYRKHAFLPLGRVRYATNLYQWDEWYGLWDGEPHWMTVDEGDYALQVSIEAPPKLPSFGTLSLGTVTEIDGDKVVVTERGTAKCVGGEGELPDPIEVGEEFRYADLSGTRGAQSLLYSFEWGEDGLASFSGMWLDPFDLRHAKGRDR